MNTVAWILQVLLALLFGIAGGMKVTQPKSKITANPNMAWANDFTETQIKGIGVLEVLGAIGLILPAITNILPQLTGLAGLGLALIMVGAIVVHYRRGETSAIVINVVLLVMAAAVAYLRLVAVPFA